MKICTCANAGIRMLTAFIGLCLGCDRVRLEHKTLDINYASKAKDVVMQICKGSPSSDSGRKLVQSICTTTNACERACRMQSVLDAVGNATFSGTNVHDRENSHARLHSFCKMATEELFKKEDWQSILELWFAEFKSLKRESEFCQMMMHHPEKSDANQHNWEGVWYTSAKHSETLQGDNMAMIVLWDDSVAARYCARLPWWRKKLVVWRIKKVIGRYPDWYLDEKKKGAK